MRNYNEKMKIDKDEEAQEDLFDLRQKSKMKKFKKDSST